jgi:hypothetical protein
MRGRRFILVAVLGIGLASAASAGIIFNRHKPSPQRCQELIGILQSDQDESKRASAAGELGEYDLKNNPEIVPVLLAALRDPSAGVRLHTVESLGKFRPVSSEIGIALEDTLAHDSSTRVRLQTRTILWQYHLAGYRSPKDGAVGGNPGNGPSVNPGNVGATPVTPPGPMRTNQEPPLADPDPVPTRVAPAPAPPPGSPWPSYPGMTRGGPPVVPPAQPQLSRPVPTPPPTLQPMPVNPGPALNPPG